MFDVSFEITLPVKSISQFVLILALVAAAIGLPVAPAQASAYLAPQSGGVFYVSATGDSNTSDWDLTLREAILLANGGTGPSGLNRSLSTHEEAYIGGSCGWDIGGNIVLGCGAGYQNTIRFLNTLGTGPVIVLSSMLPALNNPLGTILDGSYSNIDPVIDASNLLAGSFGLSVGTNNVVNSLTVTGASLWDFNVYGKNNQLTNVGAFRAGFDGINIRTDGNTVDGALVGVSSPGANNCGSGAAHKGNGGAGIDINTNVSFPSATGNTVKNSTIGCNGGAGIAVYGSGATGNTIGPNNLIGAGTQAGADLGNTGNGVDFSAGAGSNTLTANTILNNAAAGVSIVDSGQELVGGNQIRLNSSDGVYIAGNAQSNLIGGPSLLNNKLTANWIGNNNGNGVQIYGALARYNLVGGNMIGITLDGTTADPNFLSGVLLDGAQSNYIGDPASTQNTISGNRLSGVVLVNAAAANSVANNRIGVRSASNTGVPNLLFGVSLNTGAHNNSVFNNMIDNNGLTGLVIQNSTTATNTVTNNYMESNGYGGIGIHGARNNVIGTALSPNTIDNNTGNGIVVDGGATYNRVEGGSIDSNSGNGIYLSGNTTAYNIISGTEMISNGADGLQVANGAYYNMWSHLFTGDNGHAGMNLAPPAGDLPSVGKVSLGVNSLSVNGTADAPSFLTSEKVEVYFASLNSHGGVELHYWQTGPVDANGNWSVSHSGLLVPGIGLCFVAFETGTTVLFGVSSESSGIGPDSCQAMLPRVVR